MWRILTTASAESDREGDSRDARENRNGYFMIRGNYVDINTNKKGFLYITFQTVPLSYSIPWSTGFTCSDFCWRIVEAHDCSGGGITVVPEPNGLLLLVGPRASRVTMLAHNCKIWFGPWSYLNLLDLYSLETIAEWTGKALVFVSLFGQVGHTTPPLVRDCGCLRHCIWRTPS